MSTKIYYLTVIAKSEAIRTVSYQCENCGGKFSYQDSYSETCSRRDSRIGSPVPASARGKLSKDASAGAIDQMNSKIKSLDEKESYGYEECPNCGYTQSWMLKERLEAHSRKLGRAVALPFFAWIASLIWMYYIYDDVPPKPWLLFSLVVWLIATVLVFFWVLKKTLQDPNEKFGNVENKYAPTVTWKGPYLVKP